MIVCEYWFDAQDKANPGYSNSVVDFYAWIPFSPDVPNHSLHLRKNLQTGVFEVYRAFITADVISRREILVIRRHSTGRREVVFSGRLDEALKFAAAEGAHFHKNYGAEDTACHHTASSHADFCPVMQKQGKRRAQYKAEIADILYAVK